MLVLFVVLCLLLRSAVEALHEQKFDEHRECHTALICDFASGANEVGWQRNACGSRSFVWWDFGIRHG
jgi:hypothetical protein